MHNWIVWKLSLIARIRGAGILDSGVLGSGAAREPLHHFCRPDETLEMTTADQPQDNNSTAPNEAGLPAGFVAVCVLAFVASIAATAHFCRSMCCEMEMPGGWTMSMMWMRMPGRTWFESALSFQSRATFVPNLCPCFSYAPRLLVIQM